VVVFGKDSQKAGQAPFATEIQAPFSAAAFGQVSYTDGLDGVIVVREFGLRGNLPDVGAENDLFACLKFRVVEVATAVVFALFGSEFGRGAPAAVGVPIVFPGQTRVLLRGLAVAVGNREALGIPQRFVIVTAPCDFVPHAEFRLVSVGLAQREPRAVLRVIVERFVEELSLPAVPPLSSTCCRSRGASLRAGWPCGLGSGSSSARVR